LPRGFDDGHLVGGAAGGVHFRDPNLLGQTPRGFLPVPGQQNGLHSLRRQFRNHTGRLRAGMIGQVEPGLYPSVPGHEDPAVVLAAWDVGRGTRDVERDMTPAVVNRRGAVGRPAPNEGCLLRPGESTVGQEAGRANHEGSLLAAQGHGSFGAMAGDSPKFLYLSQRQAALPGRFDNGLSDGMFTGRFEGGSPGQYLIFLWRKGGKGREGEGRGGKRREGTEIRNPKSEIRM
jgi:hypothetical protein